MKRLVLLLIPVLICAASCDKNAQAKEDPPKPGDVYVAGTVEGKAVLWKNGVVQNLSDGTLEAEAKCVFVSGSNVYVAGSVGSKAILWKNGVAHNLSDDGGANSVFVFDGDVYVAGFETNKQGYYVATVWKNGVTQNLTDGTLYGVAKSVSVSGDDVYVVGDERTEKDYYTEGCFAKVWKNGIEQNFFDDSKSTMANSVFVSGGDVYATGQEYQQDTLYVTVWKNGVAQYRNRLPSNVYHSNAVTSIYVLGGDVYVTGWSQNTNSRMGTRFAKLWKNGVEQINYLVEASFNSVYVSGSGDVYVTGRPMYCPNPATVWKNGIAQELEGTCNSCGYSVFVVE